MSTSSRTIRSGTPIVALHSCISHEISKLQCCKLLHANAKLNLAAVSMLHPELPHYCLLDFLWSFWNCGRVSFIACSQLSATYGILHPQQNALKALKTLPAWLQHHKHLTHYTNVLNCLFYLHYKKQNIYKLGLYINKVIREHSSSAHFRSICLGVFINQTRA